MRDSAQQGGANLSHFIILAYTLLGQIVEHMYSDSQDPEGWEVLEEDLSQLRLVLPRSASDLAAASHTDFHRVVWLNVLLNVKTIFIYHRPFDVSAKDTTMWQHCLAAAHNTAMLIRAASRVSTDPLINPNIAAPIFTCARVLVIERLLPSSITTPDRSWSAEVQKEDLDTFLLVFDRLSEAFDGVGKKFRNGIKYHLHQSPEAVRKLKAGGSRELLASCGGWPALGEEEPGTGFHTII